MTVRGVDEGGTRARRRVLGGRVTGHGRALLRPFARPLVQGTDVVATGVFRGCHLEGARRFAVVMHVGGLLTIPTFLPFFPPTAVSPALGWGLALLFLLKLVVAAVWLARWPGSVTFPRIVAVLAGDLLLLGLLQAAAGGWAQPYYTLLYVQVAAVALILPRRIMAVYLPATLLVVLSPVATGETAGATPEVLVGLVPWTLMTVLVVTVMSRVREQRIELADVARVDALTELGNRRALRIESAGALARARSTGSLLILGVVDVDDFKSLNDHHGHLVGDACLRDVAAALAGVCGPEEHAYRWGGDEFVVLLAAGDELHASRRRDAVARALRGATAAPDGCEVRVSVGWVTDEGGATLEELLAGADAALRERKSRRR